MIKLDISNLEPKAPVVVAVCSKCKGEIYLYEEYGEDREGKVICSDCVEDEWKNLSLAEKLDVFGYDPVAQTLAIKKQTTAKVPPLIW